VPGERQSFRLPVFGHVTVAVGLYYGTEKLAERAPLRLRVLRRDREPK